MESTVTFLWWLRLSCRLTQVVGIELILMKLKFKLRVASFSKQFNPEFNLNCIHCFIKSIADSGTEISFRLNLIPFKLIGYLFWTWSVTRASVIAAVYLLISTCLFESTGNYLHTQANTRDSTENICKLCVEFFRTRFPRFRVESSWIKVNWFNCILTILTSFIDWAPALVTAF